MGNTIKPWGRRCKAQMALQGMTLADVARISGLSRTYISAIINGRVAVPEETIAKINEALLMSPPSS